MEVSKTANSKIKGITVEIDGDLTPLDNAIKQANKTIKSTQSELREVERLLKLDPENTEILAQKQKLLTSAIKETSDKLEVLKRAKEQAEKSGNVDKESYEYRYLQREIARTEQSLKSFKRQADKAGDSAGDAANELDDAGDSARDLSRDLNKAGGSAGDASGALGEMGKSAGGLSGGFSVGKAAIASFIAEAAMKLLSTIKELVEETREYREDMNKLNTAFQTGGHSAETAKKVYKDFYNILGESDRSVEAVNHLARFVKTEEDMAKWGTIAAGVTATFGDSLPIEGLTEASNETAKVGQVTGVLADALNWVGISEDKFNEKLAKCSSEQERSQLITETLNGAYLESAEAYKTMNADIMQSRDATSELSDAMARIGEALEPLMATGMTWFASLVSGTVDAVIPTKTEVQLLSDSVDDLAQKQVESKAAIEENMIQQLAQVESSRMLFEELQTLANETGFVNEANRARAEFIIGELNNALGLEIQMNNGVISSYSSLSSTIDEVIQKKQAQILLSAQEEKYAEAVKNINAAMENQSAIVAQLEEKRSSLAKLTEKGAAMTVNDSKAAEQLRNTIAGLENKLNDANATYDAYQKDIATYNAATEAAIEGNSQKVIEVLNGQNNAFQIAADVAGKSAKEQKQAMGQQLIEAVDAVSAAQDNLKRASTKHEKAYAKQQLEAAKKRATDALTQYKAVGGNMVDGIIVGLNGKKRQLSTAMVRMLRDLIVEAKKEIDSHSPSKKYRDEVGAMIAEGVAVGIKENAKKPTEEFKKLLQQLDAQKDVGLISEEEYYNKLEELRDKYLTKGTNEWWDYTKKMYDYREKENQKEIDQEKKKLEELTKEVESAYNKFIEESTKKYEEVLKERESFSKKLKDFGELYNAQAVIGYEYVWSDDKRKLTVKEKKGPALSNLKEQTGKIRTYADNLNRLKERTDIPPAFMDAIRDMSVEQGIEFTTVLLNASDTDLTDYVESWKEKQEAAESIAEGAYKDDMEEIRKSIEAEMDTVPDMLQAIAQKAGQSFADELAETIDKAMAEAAPKINESVMKAFPNVSADSLYFPTPSAPADTASKAQAVSTMPVINNYNYGVTPETAFNVSEQTRKILNNLVTMGELMV